MLTLALLRHAKSSWDNHSLEDHDRPLNERGRTTAPLMAKALKELGFTPNLILCSTAKRTRETLAILAPLFSGSKSDVAFDEQLYLTSSDVLLGRLKTTPPEAKSVLLIGHNPGLHGLALSLVATGDAKSISRLEDKFPTCALAVYSFQQTSWRDVGPASGRLEAYLTPRDRTE